MKANANFFAVGAILLAVLSTPSCRKEKDTTVQVMVTDDAGYALNNAMVRLYPDPSISPPNAIVIDDTLFTDSDGTVIFDYSDNYNLGQAGFAVLNVEVRVDTTLYGEGMVKVEAEEHNSTHVIALP